MKRDKNLNTELNEDINEASVAEVEFESSEKKPPFPSSIHEDMEKAGKEAIKKKLFGVEKENDSVSKKQALLKKLSSLVFVLFVVIVLGVTAYNDFFSGKKELPSFTEIMGVLGNNLHFLFCALLALLLCYFFKSFKLSFFCRKETGKWHFRTCVGTAIIGQYYNYITPLAVGGQPFEIYHLTTKGVYGGAAASLPIASFFLHQFSFVILSIISLVLYNTNALNTPVTLRFFPAGLTVLASIGIVCCFTVPFLVVLFCFFPKMSYKVVYFVIWLGSKIGVVKDRKNLNYKMTKNILQNAKSLKRFVKNPFTLSVSLLASFGENLALYSIAYFSLKFFGFDIVGINGFIEWVHVCIVSTLLYAAISFIPTPGNSGAADLSFYLLFESGLSSIGNVAFPATLTWRFLSFYSFIIIGFVYTKINKAREKRRKEKI